MDLITSIFLLIPSDIAELLPVKIIFDKNSLFSLNLFRKISKSLST